MQESLEVIEIDEILPKNFNLERKKNLKDFWEIQEKKAVQKRLDLYHYVVHGLATFIILSYIFLIIWNYNIPKEFSTIVSMVIGFYFAKSLFNKS